MVSLLIRRRGLLAALAYAAALPVPGAEYSGWVAHYPVRASLHRSGESIAGVYDYPRKGERLRVEGRVRGGDTPWGTFRLVEFDAAGRRSGHFEGRYTSPETIRGSWWKTEHPERRVNFYMEDVRQYNLPFGGSWSGRADSRQFSLDLTQRGPRVEGTYCSVSNRRSDCLSRVTGTIRGDSAELRWESRAIGATGSARLTRRGRSLVWETDMPSPGTVPRYAVLRRHSGP